MIRRPCKDGFRDRRLSDWCRDCGHAIVVHRAGRRCSVCEVIADLRAGIIDARRESRTVKP